VNSGHTRFFRASASCSKIVNVKSIFNTVKNFKANSIFRVSASCSNILKDKKYFNPVKIFRANSVFQGKRKLSKILNNKTICSIQIQGTLRFSGQAQTCSKIL